ncbi:MAG: SCO family protein [Bacteriovorax sp.]
MIYKNVLLFLILLINALSPVHSSDMSLYRSSSYEWKDEKNKSFKLSNLHGKKVLMAMAYTSCQGTCPMIVSKLKKSEKLFLDKKVSVEVVLITFDPEFDTPARNLSYYREKMSIEKESWHFLSGSDSETRKMSMLLGIRYAKNPQSGTIVHDNKIVLINEEGEIQKRIEGLDEDETKFIN